MEISEDVRNDSKNAYMSSFNQNIILILHTDSYQQLL